MSKKDKKTRERSKEIHATHLFFTKSLSLDSDRSNQICEEAFDKIASIRPKNPEWVWPI